MGISESIIKLVQAQTDGGKLMEAVVHHVLAA